MAVAKGKRFTYGDIQAWDDGNRFELYDGEPIMLASPSSLHQIICMEISRQIANFLDGKKCQVFPAPYDVFLFASQNDDLDRSMDVVQPDISVVCDPDKIDKRGCKGAPDLIVEIHSPSTRGNDRVTKFDLYQRAGVREYWMVSPEEQSIWAFVLEDGRFASKFMGAVGDMMEVNILPDCKIDLSKVFPSE